MTIHYRGDDANQRHEHFFGDTAMITTDAIAQCACGQWAVFEEVSTYPVRGRAHNWKHISRRRAHRLLIRQGIEP